MKSYFQRVGIAFAHLALAITSPLWAWAVVRYEAKQEQAREDFARYYGGTTDE